MKKNQIGFSAIEFLLAIVIVGLVGGVSFYVYSVNQSRKPSEAKQDQLPQAQEENTITLNNKGVAPTGWKQYKDPTYNFGFSYPPDWQVHNGTFKPGESADGSIYYVNVDVPNPIEGDGGYGIYVFDLPLDKVVKIAKGEESLQPNNFPPDPWKGTQTTIRKGTYSGTKLTGGQWGDKYYMKVGENVYGYPSEFKSESQRSKYDSYNQIIKSIVLY
jgi:hypothetical protein